MPINELKPHEKGSPIYLELLKREILCDGVLRYPIIADETTHVILDGTHRWLALKNLGYTFIPTMLVNALNNPKIRVGTKRIHRYVSESEEKITIKDVISAGISGCLMKPHSTRHFFSFSKFQQINYPLQLLEKNHPECVSEYLAKMDEKECKLAIKDWLKELIEELNFLAKRKEEVEKEMKDFLKRIKNLNGKNSMIEQNNS